MATPKISTQASTPTFPTGAAQCDRLLRVNDIRELTGWSENTARKFMRESGKLIQIHRSNYMFKARSTSFSSSLKVVPPTLIRW